MPNPAWLGFLSPEDVVVWREPHTLAACLARGFGGDDLAAYTAANRLALEAFRCGDAALAADVCDREIRYAADALARGGNPRLALLGLQPVINLIRLHGYAADLELARRGLGDLERIADGHPTRILGLTLSADRLDQLGADVAAVRALARNNCLMETAKILWRRGRRDELLAACRRLRRKWPASLTTGPFHAAEAEWLCDATAPAASDLPEPPLLRRIRLLHRVARQAGTGEAAEIAARLFARRAAACRAKPATAVARDLASLGDALLRCGDTSRGRACLAEAHAAARAVDPALANLIRGRWLDRDAGPVPPVEPAPRLPPAALADLARLAAARLRTPPGAGRAAAPRP
ncbi:MAG TPA: hypothetical protein VNV66_22110 [Pilimelia sp.]|nr:hypothetical protein [Pilimelia sp.]